MLSWNSENLHLFSSFFQVREHAAQILTSISSKEKLQYTSSLGSTIKENNYFLAESKTVIDGLPFGISIWWNHGLEESNGAWNLRMEQFLSKTAGSAKRRALAVNQTKHTTQFLYNNWVWWYLKLHSSLFFRNFNLVFNMKSAGSPRVINNWTAQQSA